MEQGCGAAWHHNASIIATSHRLERAYRAIATSNIADRAAACVCAAAHQRRGLATLASRISA